MKCGECKGTGEDRRAGVDPTLCDACDGTGEVEPCCVCGRPSVVDYGDGEDCPSCGNPACELRMQQAKDYHDERGG
jgi:RecJ-like exonuclease